MIFNFAYSNAEIGLIIIKKIGFYTIHYEGGEQNEGRDLLFYGASQDPGRRAGTACP